MQKDNEEYLSKLRHSAAHLLAAAVKELYPDAKPTIGPPIDNGFYYDFEFSEPISDKDLKNIQRRMKKLLNKWDSFERKEVSADDARELYKNNSYKLELINELEKNNETISLYKCGEFTDLCRGGHVDSPREELKAIKLLSLAGAYWRGDENNKMLTRIYGTAFPSLEELKEHLDLIEEAKKRDHRKLGKDLDLFTFSELVGKGLPLFTPKGTILRELLNDFSQGLRLKHDFKRVWIPHVTKNDLYKKSGHWDKFGDELFLVNSQETSDQLVLKPMNCPHHTQIFASQPRSYKDLPIKYLETSTIYRDEQAGELLGLSRVRSVTMDDSHIFCRPDQIFDTFQMLIDISKEFYGALELEFKVRLSYMDPDNKEKYLGDEKLWKKSQSTIKDIAVENDLNYYEGVGEAAFYGPKIDFMAIDALGREWQVATAQLDFVQPDRFELSYVDQDGSEQTPVMVHYALLGSLERFLSVYIEHTAGSFPLWLAPVQVAVLPVSEKLNDYAQKIHSMLHENDIRVETDFDNKTLPAKIRRWTLQKVPYMCIIGEKEAEKSNKELFVSVRNRNGKDEGLLSLDIFLEKLHKNIERKKV